MKVLQLTTCDKWSTYCLSLSSTAERRLPSAPISDDAAGFKNMFPRKDTCSFLISEPLWPVCSAGQALYSASAVQALQHTFHALSATALITLHRCLYHCFSTPLSLLVTLQRQSEASFFFVDGLQISSVIQSTF